MTGLIFSIFAGALLLLGCIVSTIGLALSEIKPAIDKDELFIDHAELRRSKLTNEIMNYFEENNDSDN